MNNRSVYVIDGSRTPFLRASGKGNPFSASDLAVAAGRPLLLRQPFSANELDEVILGCVMPAPDEANIARIASLRLGCGEETPAWTVQRNCGSGMQALDSGVRSIQSGQSSLVLAGGVEVMSRAPLMWSQGLIDWFSEWQRCGLQARIKHLGRLKISLFRPIIALLKGLTDPTVGLSMGQTAEELAFRFQINREQMDSFAVQSHQRLAEAQDDNHFRQEIVPLFGNDGTVYEQDQGVRRNSSVEKLGILKPVFDRFVGLLTAGNSAQITDGACWLLLANEETVQKYALQPLGKITAASWAGLDPSQMGLGPVHASFKLLREQHIESSEVDYWEINEAFAAQVLACSQALTDESYCHNEVPHTPTPLKPIPSDRLNVDGGAISIGHPVGASGARIVLHLLHLLKRKGARRGIATLCIGGGQGGAMMAEAV